MQSLITVLITGVGAPGTRGTLYALKHNPDEVKIKTIGTDLNSEAIGRFWVDHFYPLPAPEDADYLKDLLSICERESVDIVIPQTTREVAVLSQHRTGLAQQGIKLMASNANAIEVANNKWKLLEIFRELELPRPVYYLARSERELVESAGLLGYPKHPVVIKPPVSNGMRGFRILREDAWNLQRFLTEKPGGEDVSLEEVLKMLRRGSYWPELLVTEYLPGPEYSVDAFVGERVSIAIPRLRKIIRSGISFVNMLEHREDLNALTLRAARHIGLEYAFGFQFKMDERGTPKVLECNPRVQGTMVASVFGGINVIWLSIRELLGNPCSDLSPAFKPAVFLRFWGGVGSAQGIIDEI
jgi:carbamoyl-phosphate synthase large subunit